MTGLNDLYIAAADMLWSWAQSAPLPDSIIEQIARLTCGILCTIGWN